MSKRLDVTYVRLKADLAYQLVRGNITWSQLEATEIDLNYYTINRYFAEAVGFTDIPSLNLSKNASEILSFSESKELTVQKQISEALSMIDNVDIILVIYRDFSDSTAISDASVLAVDKNISEALTVSDIASISSAIAKTESISFADDPALSLSKPFTDSLGLTESFDRNASYVRSFSDAFSLDDIEIHTNGAELNKNNVFAFSDTNTFSFQKNATDSLSFSENFSHEVTRSNHSVLNTSALNTFTPNS